MAAGCTAEAKIRLSKKLTTRRAWLEALNDRVAEAIGLRMGINGAARRFRGCIRRKCSGYRVKRPSVRPRCIIVDRPVLFVLALALTTAAAPSPRSCAVWSIALCSEHALCKLTIRVARAFMSALHDRCCVQHSGLGQTCASHLRAQASRCSQLHC